MSDWYKRTYDFNPYYRWQWVAAMAASLPAQSKVLDVGAGTGRYRSFFTHCDYYAHDLGQTPVLAGQYIKLDYQSDINEIPVPDESFDVVLCTEVIEHVPEPIKAIEEMARVLKKGGRLLLTAPLASFLHQEPYHFYGGYTPHWYRKFLTGAGLEIESIQPNWGFFSWFGQESVRFSSFIDPRRTQQKGVLTWLGLTILWTLTLPLLRGLFPLLGRPLDKLALEHMATVGYHVVAIKKDS